MVKISFRIPCTIIGIVDYMTSGLLLAAGYGWQRSTLLVAQACRVYGAVWCDLVIRCD